MDIAEDQLEEHFAEHFLEEQVVEQLGLGAVGSTMGLAPFSVCVVM